MKARILSACVLVPVVFGAAVAGGIPFLLLVLLICGITAWEFGRIFDQKDGMRVPLIQLVISVLVLILARWFMGIDASHRILTLCIMGAILCGTILCEKEVPKSALSFTVLTTGMVYIGWLGGYMISLRQLPDGMVKFLLVIALIWIYDVGAFLSGSRSDGIRCSKSSVPRRAGKASSAGSFSRCWSRFCWNG